MWQSSKRTTGGQRLKSKVPEPLNIKKFHGLPHRLTSSGRLWLMRITVVFLFSTGCSDDGAYRLVDFSERLPTESSHAQEADAIRLRVAVAAMVSPKETLSYYQALIDYLGEKLGREVQLIQRKTYGEVDALFLKGQIDLGFICSGPYASGKDRYGFEALVTPVIRGKPFYQSYLIVNRDASFKDLEALRGHRFAFSDPESNSGALVPQYWLARMKERPETFFKSITYTYSHDNSIMGVARSLFDGAAVDGHKWEYYSVKESPYISKTRVIRKSDPIGSPPLVASKFMSRQSKDAIREIFSSMHMDPEGKKILKGLLIDRFVATDESWYDPVRMMTGVVRGPEQAAHVSKES
ncbi:MAG: phosphate/phosphite/phosphonate ABC transporter substrate-binding protein [Desulfobacteraceae bacterium]|nr:MAG: phosphate/phosphite/phosphonate ABC transporter substrate-binding protein [Desulfobacteraceae bacterium]